MISVALATYNGAKYLREQLDSIASQSLLPDELVISDDCSRDGTLSIARAFAARASVAVRILEGEANVGSTRNFERAINACEGEVIALCDQDDVWEPRKLQQLSQVLVDTAVGVAFSDATLIDSGGRPLPGRLWEFAHLDGPARQSLSHEPFPFLLRHTMITGATMAFRTRPAAMGGEDLRKILFPIPHGPLIHDGWIALAASAFAGTVPIEEPLVRYRQHAEQQTGVATMESSRTAGAEHYAGQKRQLQALYERLWPRRDEARSEAREALRTLPHHIAHLDARLRLPRNLWRRANAVAREASRGCYHRYSNGWKSIARDLLP